MKRIILLFAMMHSLFHATGKITPFVVSYLLILFQGCSSTEGLSVSQNPSWLYPDSTCLSFFKNGEDTILFNPDTIKCYRLKYSEEKIASSSVLNGFIRDSTLQVLDERQSTVLQYILLSNSLNYTKDTITLVQSPYIPVVEYEFIKKDKEKSISAVISLSDMTWQIIQGDSVYCNYNYADPVIINRFCQYFLK